MPSALASPTGFVSRASSARGRVVAVGIGVALSVFALRAWSASYADHLGGAIALGLAAALAPAAQLASPAGPPHPIEDETPLPPLALRSAALGSKKSSQKPARSRGPSVPHGVRVSAAQVLALAARRAMPQAVPVKANAQHPAGLLLRGVSALGVGMQDGDVLTEAAGQKASSLAVVVGVVLAARGRQAPEISGRFYRAGVPFTLTVEQPYPKQPVPG